MTRIILCEGETDQILLAYYLEHAHGWTYAAKAKTLQLKEFSKQDNRAVCAYRNQTGDELIICAVGGKDNFGNFFHEFLEQPIVRSHNGETSYRIALVADRDDSTTEEVERSVAEQLSPLITNVANDRWVMNKAAIDFDGTARIEFLLVSIPKEGSGALESLLLQALASDVCRTSIIQQSGQFVTDIKELADNYIGTPRLQLKAHLGVSLSILNPEKVFSIFQEQLQSIPWETSPVIRQCFARLAEI